MAREITFEKYNDPFLKPEDIDPEILEEVKERWNKNLDGDPDRQLMGDKRLMGGFNEDDDDEIEEERPGKIDSQIRFIMTPMGVLPFDRSMTFTANFNLWIAHTNFKLINEYKSIIEKTEGIETLEYISQYRFKFSVGKMFEPSFVFENIRRNLGAELKQQKKLDYEEFSSLLKLPETVNKKVEEIKKKIPVNNDWIIYILPNNEVDYISGQANEENFIHKAKVFLEAQSLVGGLLFSSNQ